MSQSQFTTLALHRAFAGGYVDRRRQAGERRARAQSRAEEKGAEGYSDGGLGANGESGISPEADILKSSAHR